MGSDVHDTNSLDVRNLSENTWGFTKYTTKQFEEYQEQGRVIDRGVHVEIANGRGKVDETEPENLYIRWDVLRRRAEKRSKNVATEEKVEDDVKEDDDDEDDEESS